MSVRSRLLLAMLAAALMLALTVGTATARRFNLSSTNFSMRWREFAVPTGTTEESREERIRYCPLTLSGSFHSRTITKAIETLVGYVTSATMGTCTGEGGRVTFLSTGLPWHLRYKEFAGFLPQITRFRLALLGFGMSIEVPPLFGTVCLIRTTAMEPLRIDFTRETATGAITTVGGTESLIDARDTTGFLCDGSVPPLAWRMGGNGTLDNGAGARVTVTLI
ncbi:MAG TPA: hypothetical protein VGO48_06110 [Conexibacter sp.]|jgi:hypothetical protein|nr:hypothetical protein [Conexibacter sp.]